MSMHVSHRVHAFVENTGFLETRSAAMELNHRGTPENTPVLAGIRKSVFRGGM
jgi:hypothetical protein